MFSGFQFLLNKLFHLSAIDPPSLFLNPNSDSLGSFPGKFEPQTHYFWIQVYFIHKFVIKLSFFYKGLISFDNKFLILPGQMSNFQFQEN